MRTLTVDRVVAAPPERVWRAWTDPAVLAAWFWPPRFETTAEVDARPGGAFRVASAPVGIGVSGAIARADPARLLETSWRWDGDDEETRVTVTFELVREGTRVVVRHEGFDSDEAVAEHVQGWNDCLDRLPAVLD